MAWYTVKRAEKRGELKPGRKIIEVTSGKTGIALAMISAARGYKFIAVMPQSMSTERTSIMRQFGSRRGAHSRP
jgi:cysteine synthase